MMVVFIKTKPYFLIPNLSSLMSKNVLFFSVFSEIQVHIDFNLTLI